MDKVFYFSESQINSENSRNDIIRTGNFTDMNGKEFSLSKDHLQAAIENFPKNPLMKQRKGRPAVPVNYNHNQSGKAAGWLFNPQLETRPDGHVYLTAEIEWVGEGKKAVAEGEYSYISAELIFNYKNESGQKFDLILSGAGLTNIPAVAGMNALKLQQTTQQGVNKMPLQQVMDMVKTLSPDEMMQVAEVIKNTLGDEFDMVTKEDATAMKADAVNTVKKEMQMQLQQQQTSVQAQIHQLQEANKQISDKLALKEKEASFALLLAEGKAVEAQRAFFMSGDLEGFARHAVHVNLEAKGHGGNQSNDAVRDAVRQAEAHALKVQLDGGNYAAAFQEKAQELKITKDQIEQHL